MRGWVASRHFLPFACTRKRLSPTPNELAFPMEVVHCRRHTIRSRFVGDYLCGAVHVWFPDGLVGVQWSPSASGNYCCTRQSFCECNYAILVSDLATQD